MGNMTVKQAAERWGVTTRRVQDLCKRGEIYGAQLWERTWMIPEDAEYPSKKDKNEVHNFNMKLPRKSPYLDMTDLYNIVGGADVCAQRLEGQPESKLLFEAEIAYSRGEIDKVYEYANLFLNSHSGFYAIVAGGILLSMCAMWKGDVQMWYKARAHILEAPCKNEVDHDIVALSIAAADSAIRDTRDFPEWFKHGCFDNLPRDAHPAARVYYIKYLIIVAQALAMGEMDLDGVSGLGLMKTLPYIMEPMISQMVVDKVIMAEIYLRLLCAVAYHQSGDYDRAVAHLDKAIKLCLADGLYGPLVEHRRQLGIFLDDRLALIDADALKKVRELHKILHDGWTKIHNAVLERTVSVELTPREREVARLVVFGFSDNEIAERLHISKSTVKTLISMAKNKTGSMKRSELIEYI